LQIGAMNHPARDPIAEVDWIGRHGFDFVDLTLEPPAADPALIDPAALRDVLDRHGLGVVAHTAWFLPLGSPFAGVRQACLDEFRRCLRTARAVGASVMNTHYVKRPGFFSLRQSAAWHAEVLGPLCVEAAEQGITIVLEHVPFGGADQLETIAAILEEVPLLRFHLDSGHARLERGGDRWEEYLDKLGHKLLHVHLSENDGTADQHLPLGAAPRGTSDWPGRIRKLRATGYDGTITLEVFAPRREYLLASRELLREWWTAAAADRGDDGPARAQGAEG
jgi:sugar phosphate isomerase/epimerase